MSVHRTNVIPTGTRWAVLCADCTWCIRGCLDKVQAAEFGRGHVRSPSLPHPEIAHASMPSWDPPSRRR